MFTNVLRLCLITLFCSQLNAMDDKTENKLIINMPNHINSVVEGMADLIANRMAENNALKEIIELRKELQELKINYFQIGFINAFAGNNAPIGWLLCDGQSYSRDKFQNLYNIINNNFGGDDYSMTFKVPDLRGRMITGLDYMGGIPANILTISTFPEGSRIGATGGHESQTLGIEHMPSHHHNGNMATNDGHRFRGDPHGCTLASIGKNQTEDIGGSQPHNIMNPCMQLIYVIKY